ncbi:MAG: sulfate adenylyltransferase [Hyphomicrobiaceae bacterium]|nr:MAG: sulfate adenylyltransferase [Hyphomicrobiaceae bacterium]
MRFRTAEEDARAEAAGSLHVLTCGSVDDGKSTLIGRLLWDTAGLHADQRETLQRSPKTAAGTPDFSLLVDGLAAEREQGITIDVAWRYLDAQGRRLVIIDSPGHEQYTRNMATGASHADVAILLVDARGGIKQQTRRHAAILDLIGVRRVVLAINKMDLVGWSETRFAEIGAEFAKLAQRFGFDDAVAIPVSAVLGDNIARRSLAMPWYGGVPLLEHLAGLPARGIPSAGAFRFPVQLVVRAGQDFRGLAGTVSAGEIKVGDDVVEPVGGRRARVRRIVTMGRDLEAARQGQAVVLQLDADIDVSRGAVLASPGREPAVARGLDARLVWLSDERFSADRGYLLRTATDLIPIASIEIRAHLDLETLAERQAATCAANDIAVARIDLSRSAAIDLFSDQCETGTFMLIDPITGASVAGGVVRATHLPEARLSTNAFRLTRDLIARGIGADLAGRADADSERELRRRANEVAILLRQAGVAVELDDEQGAAGGRAAAAWPGVVAVLSLGFVAAVLLGLI